MPSAIEVVDVVKRYGTLEALAGVSLAVEEGEFFGLLGPNGAGKTTLINIIAGLARASSGRVSVMGADVVRDYRRSRRMLGVGSSKGTPLVCASNGSGPCIAL